MPILGADMTAGTLVAWRKQPGDTVKRGDIIAEVETDKGLIDVEVFVTGAVEQILIQPGATVPTGTVLALIREEGPAPAATPPAGGTGGRAREAQGLARGEAARRGAGAGRGPAERHRAPTARSPSRTSSVRRRCDRLRRHPRRRARRRTV